MNWKLWGSTGVALVLGGVLVSLSLLIDQTPTNRIINVALLILGVCAGWLIGTVISPYSDAEKERFSAYTKAFSAFLSGYAVAKIDAAVNAVFDPDVLFEPLLGFRFVSVVSMFVLSMLITFFFRQYARV